jgi:DNA-binding transcriptional LysR family regulator
MHNMHEFLPTKPFDLYELHLLHLVARHCSFTGAAHEAGLTQSAITRQVQGVEGRLGLPLFERTTRRVVLTSAGSFLLRETSRLVGDLDAILLRLREDFSDAPKEVRVGVAKTISMSYLPGFFAAQQRRQPNVRLKVEHLDSRNLLTRLETNELDIIILSSPKRLPASLRTTHRFDDAFDLIIPSHWPFPASNIQRGHRAWRDWLHAQPWLLISETSTTGVRLRAWLRKKQWIGGSTTELDSFDLIVNLVALGQGVSVVPKRTLAIYGRQRKLKRLSLPDRFEREIVVVARRQPTPPAHITEFVENILF